MNQNVKAIAEAIAAMRLAPQEGRKKVSLQLAANKRRRDELEQKLEDQAIERGEYEIKGAHWFDNNMHQMKRKTININYNPYQGGTNGK